MIVATKECLEFEDFCLFAGSTNLVLWILYFYFIPMIKEE